jgi:hypothetical protein
MATSFSGGRSRSTQREPLTMGKQLVNFITCVIYKAGREHKMKTKLSLISKTNVIKQKKNKLSLISKTNVIKQKKNKLSLISKTNVFGYIHLSH